MKLTPKQEKFCREVVKGKSYSEAYRIAYNTSTERKATVWDAASKVASLSEVTQRIHELQCRLTDRLLMSKEEWLGKLDRMAMADIRKVFDSQGNVLDINAIEQAEADCIEGIEVMENFVKVGDHAEHVGYTKRIKFASKRNILKDYGQARGWMDQDERDNGPKTIIIRKFVAQEVQHVHHHSNGASLDGMRDGGTASATHSAAAGLSTVAAGASGGGGEDRSDAGPATSPQCAVGADVPKYLPAECVPAAEQPVSNGIRRRTISPRVPVKKNEHETDDPRD